MKKKRTCRGNQKQNKAKIQEKSKAVRFFTQEVLPAETGRCKEAAWAGHDYMMDADILYEYFIIIYCIML